MSEEQSYQEAQDSLSGEYEEVEEGDGTKGLPQPPAKSEEPEVIDNDIDPEEIPGAPEGFYKKEMEEAAETAEKYADTLEQYGERDLADQWQDYSQRLREQADRELSRIEKERDETLYAAAVNIRNEAKILEEGIETLRDVGDALEEESVKGVRPANTKIDDLNHSAAQRLKDAAERVTGEDLDFEHYDPQDFLGADAAPSPEPETNPEPSTEPGHGKESRGLLSRLGEAYNVIRGR